LQPLTVRPPKVNIKVLQHVLSSCSYSVSVTTLILCWVAMLAYVGVSSRCKACSCVWKVCC
ncbi:hypothetical protein QQP08_024442, partial [Theobroma cacao]